MRAATGARRRPTTSPATPRVGKASTPRRLGPLASHLPCLPPPTSTHSPLHLGRSLPPRPSETAAEALPWAWPRPPFVEPPGPRAPSTSSSSTPRFRTSWSALQRPGQAFPQPRSPSSAAIDSASPLRSRSLKGLHVPRRKPPHPPPSSGSPSCTVDGSRRRRRHCRMRPRPRARCAHPVHLRAKPWPPSSFRRFVEPTSAVC